MNNNSTEFYTTRNNTRLFSEVFIYLNEKGAETGIVEGSHPYEVDAWDIPFRGLVVDIYSSMLDKDRPERGMEVTLRARGDRIRETLADVLQKFDFKERKD